MLRQWLDFLLAEFWTGEIGTLDCELVVIYCYKRLLERIFLSSFDYFDRALLL